MAAETAAKRIVAFDMDEIAQRKGTAISAPLFGALAGSGALPFPAEYFRAQISSFGKSVERSLQAFEEAMKHGATPAPLHPAPLVEKFFPPMPEQTGTPELDRLLIRIRGEFPDIAWPMIFTGVCRLVDYQDAAYADSYLDRLSKLRRFDCSARDHIMTIAAARTISAAMSYDDVIRVADLKTRRSRFARIALAHGQETGDSIHIIESMHPGAAEIVGLLPARIGLWIEGKPRILTGLGWMFGGARQVKTSRLLWFAVLYAIGGLRRFRRGTFRHHREMHNIDAWLDQVLLHADNYDLAVQMLEARSLVKGYSDTLDRGLAKFNAIMGCVPALHNRPDGGEWIRRLIAAALAAESMEPLSGAIKTVQSLSAPGSEHSCQ
jgi:indolepyruvate ferredoxin oxidoreductase beta subunit